jgi:hypothetical protein
VSNEFLNETVYANTMLLLAKNELVTGRLVNSKFENKVTDENGLTVSVKRPPRFARNDASLQSAALATQDVISGSVNVAVNQYAKVHITIGDIEYIKSYNELLKNETMKSAASTLAHQIDGFLQSKMFGFHSYVGNATDPSLNIGSPLEFNPVHTRLMDMGVPNSDLNATVLFNDGEEIRGSLLSGNIDDVNKAALQRVRIPILSEIKLYATQQCPSLTVGTRVAGATSLIDNGTLSVNYRAVKDTMVQTIHIDGQGAGVTIKTGEVFTIANVFAWDWRNNQILPYLQQFTVRGGASVASGSVPITSPPGTPITTDAGGDIDLIISPPLIVQGTNDGVDTNANTAFATVNAAAVDGAAVTHLGAASSSHRIRTAWHKSALTMVSAKLQTPFTGVSSFARDPETNISIRYWRGSDITTGQHIHRWDCMYGATLLDSFMGSRVSGT